MPDSRRTIGCRIVGQDFILSRQVEILSYGSYGCVNPMRKLLDFTLAALSNRGQSHREVCDWAHLSSGAHVRGALLPERQRVHSTRMGYRPLFTTPGSGRHPYVHSSELAQQLHDIDVDCVVIK